MIVGALAALGSWVRLRQSSFSVRPREQQLTLPPVVQFLLTEFPDDNAHKKLTQQFKDKVFVRDVNDQARHSLATFEYADDPQTSNPGLVVYAGDGLNPLGLFAKCFASDCWPDRVLAFGRLAGLYADSVLIRDPFSSWLANFELGDNYLALHRQLWMVRAILPLMQAGAIRFAAPTVHCCKTHAPDVYAKAEGALDAILDSYIKYALIEVLTDRDGISKLTVSSRLLAEEGFAAIYPLRPELRTAISKALKSRNLSG
jgi:hypothetical protein